MADERAYVRVVETGDKSKEPRVLQPPAHVGGQRGPAVRPRTLASLSDVALAAARYNARYIFSALRARYNALRIQSSAFEPSQRGAGYVRAAGRGRSR